MHNCINPVLAAGMLFVKAVGTLLPSPTTPVSFCLGWFVCFLLVYCSFEEGGSRKGMGGGQLMAFTEGLITQRHQDSLAVRQETQEHVCLMRLKKNLQRATICILGKEQTNF